MKGYLYILECSNGTYYTGSTVDLDKRIAEHQSGKGANYTRKYSPVELVYAEVFPTIDQAFKKEKQIQNWSHGKKKALIEEDWGSLVKLSNLKKEN